MVPIIQLQNNSLCLAATTDRSLTHRHGHLCLPTQRGGSMRSLENPTSPKHLEGTVQITNMPNPPRLCTMYQVARISRRSQPTTAWRRRRHKWNLSKPNGERQHIYP